MSTNKNNQENKYDNFYEFCNELLTVIMSSKQKYGVSYKEALFALNLLAFMLNGTANIGAQETINRLDDFCKGLKNASAFMAMFGEDK